MKVKWLDRSLASLRYINRAGVLSTTLILSAASLVHAQTDQTGDNMQTAADVGAGQRINMSGKLRMLSQRIVASACYAQAGAASDASSAMLDAATSEFELIAAALQFGDTDLGIYGEEPRRKTVATIERLNLLWGPYDALTAEVLAGDATPQVVQELANQSQPLLEMAQLLVTRLSAQYSRPGDLLQMDSMAIDIAGRQRMLAQRVSKNVCLMSTGSASEGVMRELASAAEMFENSLYALRGGMPAAGIRTPPNGEIEDGLDGVIADWLQIQPDIARVLAEETLDTATLAEMFAISNRLTGGMNAVVTLYSEASKTGN